MHFPAPAHLTQPAPAPEPAPASRDGEVEQLRTALTLIIDQQRGECERTVRGSLGSCFDAGHTADAKYADDMACPGCIAHAALNGLDIPLGPGRWALEEIPANQLAAQE